MITLPWNATNVELKQYFARRVSNITSSLGLDMMAWEDGLMGKQPMDKGKLYNDNVYVNAWNNVWEYGNGARAYLLANNGYKVW